MLLKIKTFVLFFLVLNNFVFAQSSSSTQKIKQEIEALFVKADKSNLQDVLVYKIGDKTGFVNAKTNQKLLEPTEDLKEVTLFKPNMRGKYKGSYTFEVIANNFEVIVNPVQQYGREGNFHVTSLEERQSKIKVISSKDGYKGFSVDEKGELTSYSDLYFVQKYHAFNVSPFEFKGKYYAIVNKETGEDEYWDAIIDAEGTPLPHFNFMHKCIDLAKKELDDIWFTYGTCRNLKGSCLSFNNKEKLKDELVSTIFWSNNIFKYNHNHRSNDITSGVLDTENLIWILKPQSDLKIKELDYTSKKDLNYQKLEDRPFAIMYYLVEDGNKEYYIDFKGEKHLPK